MVTFFLWKIWHNNMVKKLSNSIFKLERMIYNRIAVKGAAITAIYKKKRRRKLWQTDLS